MTIEQYTERSSAALATTQDAAITRLTEWAQSADAATPAQLNRAYR